MHKDNKCIEIHIHNHTMFVSAINNIALYMVRTGRDNSTDQKGTTRQDSGTKQEQVGWCQTNCATLPSQ